jgi:RNA polymerase sigma factor (sigma-70 family)
VRSSPHPGRVRSRRYLFRLFAAAAPAGDHVPDRELLRRFIETRDSAAFELLVRRHADAVWAAALRIVGNEADADDVFQATFLALLRKAGSVRDACIGGWLHRVSVNAALKLKASRERSSASRPEEHAHRSLTLPARQEQEPHESDELAAIVHQELARLPERYRLPVVLCDLEGQTHAEAAKSLGWPIGSVSGRLSRARDTLRARLTRRGLSVPALLITAITAPTNAVSAATALAAGTVVVSPTISSLTEGVLSAMRIARLKLIAAIVAASGLVAVAGIGTGYALTRPGPSTTTDLAQPVPENVAQKEEPKPEDWTPKSEWVEGKKGERIPVRVPTAFPDLKLPERRGPDFLKKIAAMYPLILGDKPPTVLAADDPLRRLLKARLHQGRMYLKKVQEVIEIGNWNPAYFSELMLCLNDMRAVAIELWGNDPKVLIPWLEEFVIMGKYVDDFIFIRSDAGNEPPQNIHAAQRHRLEAEAALWKARNAQWQGGK